MRCIIVEDEPLAEERLREYIAKVPVLTLVGAFHSAETALASASGLQPQLAFVDINLGGASGIELVESRLLTCSIVFTTAYAEHAIRAFDLRVADYLLKPFSFARFMQAVERAQPHTTAVRSHAHGAVRSESVFVKTEQRYERIAVSDILFIEADRDYRRIHTVDRRIMTLVSFADFESSAASYALLRVHRSYMVAIDKIDSIERDMIRIREHQIPVSETYRERLLEAIGERLPKSGATK